MSNLQSFIIRALEAVLIDCIIKSKPKIDEDSSKSQESLLMAIKQIAT